MNNAPMNSQVWNTSFPINCPGRFFGTNDPTIRSITRYWSSSCAPDQSLSRLRFGDIPQSRIFIWPGSYSTHPLFSVPGSIARICIFVNPLPHSYPFVDGHFLARFLDYNIEISHYRLINSGFVYSTGSTHLGQT